MLYSRQTCCPPPAAALSAAQLYVLIAHSPTDKERGRDPSDAGLAFFFAAYTSQAAAGAAALSLLAWSLHV